ncbi:hypothetical protein MVEN_00631000 [Mycena venus]|uniref:DUF6534 domain-containing protein n=1 Tax=Mycena venus TaxID=2733690 RepID=A0A8H6YQ52_9AGAR|nr:hypothetical protein MVEN_00631000 [Mycena venus]
MASPLGPTFGIWLVALLLQSILYGMGLLQAYLYFFWYPKDNWGFKGTVATMTILETFQTAMFFAAVYTLLIDGFGDLDKLALIPWQAAAQLLAVYASTFVAQAYFSYCIYLLHKENAILPALVVMLALVGLGGGIAQVILVVRVKEFGQLSKTSAATNTQAALALICDVLITVGLCWRLHSNRSGLPSSDISRLSHPLSKLTSADSTNRVLNFLITTAINRGVLTMLTAVTNMILFLAKPRIFYFQLMLLLSGKFYMNSSTPRQHAFGKFTNAGVEHISLLVFSTSTPENANAVSNVSVTRETQLDNTYQ